ncbi:hypothetical protein QYM36_006677, partial [Artemia franciscana]
MKCTNSTLSLNAACSERSNITEHLVSAVLIRWQNEIQADASKYLVQIADVLNRVPREMLLIFKTNDLLRSIEYALKTQHRKKVNSVWGDTPVLRNKGYISDGVIIYKSNPDYPVYDEKDSFESSLSVESSKEIPDDDG